MHSFEPGVLKQAASAAEHWLKRQFPIGCKSRLPWSVKVRKWDGWSGERRKACRVLQLFSHPLSNRISSISSKDCIRETWFLPSLHECLFFFFFPRSCHKLHYCMLFYSFFFLSLWNCQSDSALNGKICSKPSVTVDGGYISWFSLACASINQHS